MKNHLLVELRNDSLSNDKKVLKENRQMKISPQRSLRPSNVSFVIFDDDSPDLFDDVTSTGLSTTLKDMFDGDSVTAGLEDTTDTCAGIRGLISMVKSTSQSRGHFCTN